MNPEPLPDVYRAALDDATFDAYLRDLRALDGPLEVRTKQAAGRYADETAWTLDDAVAALTSGSVRAIQVRYRLASDIWCDTIMGGGHGAPRQLVRMAALVVALLCALPGAVMGQEPQPQQDGQAAEPASDDGSDAPDLSGGPAVGVEGATDASSDDPEPSAPVEPPAAPAEDTFPLGWYVDAFTRPEVRTGYDELGQTDNDLVRFRFRFALFLRPLELGRVRVSARFEPQAGGAWSSGATLVDATLGLHQGFVTIANDRVSVQLGRQELNYGEHLVIGAVPWHQLGRAFDAAKVRVDLGGHGAWLDVFGAQVVELGDNGFGDGDHDACVGRHDNAELVAGWAPGGSDNVLPDDVGLHLPSNQTHLFILEVHYNNQAGHQDAFDRSGVRVCATSDRRPNTAGMHWLGTENLLMVRAGRHLPAPPQRPREHPELHAAHAPPRRAPQDGHRPGGRRPRHPHRRPVRLREPGAPRHAGHGLPGRLAGDDLHLRARGGPHRLRPRDERRDVLQLRRRVALRRPEHRRQPDQRRERLPALSPTAAPAGWPASGAAAPRPPTRADRPP